VVILDLVGAVGRLAEGAVASVPVTPAERPTVERWCEHTGNTVVGYDKGRVIVRRGRAPDPLAELPADRRPGARLWLYTNFDCNLACDYCCVRSSPRTPRRALGRDTVRRIAGEAVKAGVSELLLTGGEPFLLPDLDELVSTCVAARPTTLLTNGMLFRGRRLAALRRMPRAGLALQISIDSATPERHDAHRGAGSWARAVAGVRTALAEGFRVRLAATLTTTDIAEEAAVRTLFADLGIPPDDQVLRPVAHRGFADDGVTITTDSVVPEITVTADGVYWHPVGADDADQFVRRSPFPLADAIAQVRTTFAAQRSATNAQAQLFPCA